MIGLDKLLVKVLVDESQDVTSANRFAFFAKSVEHSFNSMSSLQNSFWWSLLVLLIVYLVKHFTLKTPSISNSLFNAIIEFPNDICIALIPIIIAWGSRQGQVYAGFYFALIAVILNLLVLLGRHHSAKFYNKGNKVMRALIPILVYVGVIFFSAIVYSLFSAS